MTFRSYGHKPWGHYLNIFDASYTKVKEILIKPGEAPSYQYHHKRSEIWVIVKGTAEVKLDDEVRVSVGYLHNTGLWKPIQHYFYNKIST